jgi:hypothetical protein
MNSTIITSAITAGSATTLVNCTFSTQLSCAKWILLKYHMNCSTGQVISHTMQAGMVHQWCNIIILLDNCQQCVTSCVTQQCVTRCVTCCVTLTNFWCQNPVSHQLQGLVNDGLPISCRLGIQPFAEPEPPVRHVPARSATTNALPSQSLAKVEFTSLAHAVDLFRAKEQHRFAATPLSLDWSLTDSQHVDLLTQHVSLLVSLLLARDSHI